MQARRLLGYLVVRERTRGRPVVLGRVRDLAVSEGGSLILLGEGGSYFRRVRFAVPWQGVVAFRVGRIFVRDEAERADLPGWLGRRVAGGVLRDLRFRPEDGRVEALIVSEGVLRDLLGGRILVPYEAGGGSAGLSRLRLEGHRARRR